MSKFLQEIKQDYKQRRCEMTQPENGDRKKSFCAEGLMHSDV